MEKNDSNFTAEATYYNISANTLFIALVGFLLTYYSWQKNDWSLLTKMIFIISIILLLLTIVLFFSKLSTRQIMINNSMLSIGKRSFQAEDIDKIECTAIGRAFHIHVKNIDESLTLRMKEQHQVRTRKYVQKWCERNKITFIDK